MFVSYSVLTTCQARETIAVLQLDPTALRLPAQDSNEFYSTHLSDLHFWLHAKDTRDA